MKRKYGAIAMAAILCGALAFTGCGSGGSAQSSKSSSGSGSTSSAASGKTTDYKYGQVQIPCLDGALCGAPLYVAYENGYFADEGIDAKLIAADTESRKIGLNEGTYPITNGDFMYFQSIEKDVNVTVVDGLHNGCIKVIVPKDSDVKSAKDLVGKNIGVDEVGGPPHQATSLWLENEGVKASGSDAQVKFLPYSDGNLELQALDNGDISAAAIWDPIASASVKSGNYKEILDIGKDGIFKDKYCCFVYASDKVLKENPDEIAALLRAIRKAEQWINKNPEKTVDIIKKGNYSEVDDTDLAVQLIKDYKYPTEKELKSGDRNVKDTVQFFAEQLYNIGYLKTEPSELMKKLYTEVDV